MANVPLYITVEPVDKGNHSTKPDIQETAPVELSKALTLSYQLPDAQTEIRRLEELRRSLDKDLHKFKPTKRSEQTVLSDWLRRNEELSLADVNLGDSDTTIKSISEEEVTGFGRYALRGDLRAWMDRVATLDSNTPAIAGEWTAEDAKAIDGELHEQVRRVVAADVVNKRKRHIELVQHMCAQLKYISDGRNFHIDSEFVTDDTEQLRRLSEYIDDWQTHIERHGHPHKQTEAEVARRLAEAEAKRRATEQGLVAAGKSVGMDLTDEQLDRVLAAFYEQRQPTNFLSKKEKVRLERKMVSQMKFTSAIEAQHERFDAQLQNRVNELEAEIHRLEAALAEERNDPMKRRNTMDSLEQANATVRTAAEVLARKRIRESEDIVLRISQEFEALLAAHSESEANAKRLVAENEALKAQVASIDLQWKRLNVLRQQQEEEMARLHGGRVSDLQRLVTTLHDVFSFTLDNFNSIVGDARRAFQVVPFSEAEKIMAAVRQWCESILCLSGITEGVRAATKALAQSAQEASHEAAQFHTQNVEAAGNARLHSDKEYIDALVRRMDVAAGELQSNFREKRVMKQAIAYFTKLVSAISDGRYEEFVDGLRSENGSAQIPFPAPEAIHPDEAYAPFWTEEFRSLERTIMLLRAELHDTTDRSIGTNTLLHAVEVYGEALHSSPSAPVESSPAKAHHTSLPEPVTEVFQVKRDARMMLLDHTDRNRLKSVSATQLLKNIVQQKATSTALPLLRSTRVVDLHRSATALSAPVPSQVPLPEPRTPPKATAAKRLGRV